MPAMLRSATVVLILLATPCEVLGREPGAEDLLALARRKFPDLSAAEAALLRRVARGEIADFRSGSVEVDPLAALVRTPLAAVWNQPALGPYWGRWRVLGTRCIAWLCDDAAATAHVGRRGLWIKGARLEGKLDLHSARLTFPLTFEACSFRDEIDLTNAEVFALDFSGTHTGPIKAGGLVVKRDLKMSDGFEAKGKVDLDGAEIGGETVLTSGTFLNKGEVALSAYRLKAHGSVRMGKDEDDPVSRKGFRAEGEVKLLEAVIDVNLTCEGGHFLNLGKDKKGRSRKALNGDGLIVKGSVFLTKGFRSEGEVRLLDASIGEEFGCYGGEFHNKGSSAINAERLKVHGAILFSSSIGPPLRAEGRVNLSAATIDGYLKCSGSRIVSEPGTYALYAPGIKVGGEIDLGSYRSDEGFTSIGFWTVGSVDLTNAVVGTDLICSGANISCNDRLDLDGGQYGFQYSIDADGIQVNRKVLFNGGFSAIGAVSLARASVASNIDCTGGTFFNPSGNSLITDRAKVGGNFILNGARISGRDPVTAIEGELFQDAAPHQGVLRLTGTTIAGDLICEATSIVNFGPITVVANGAKIVKFGPMAVVANGAKIEGSARLSDGFEAKGGIELKRTSIHFDLHFTGSKLGAGQSPGGAIRIIDAEGLEVDGSLVFDEGFEAEGTVFLYDAAIGRYFHWRGFVPRVALALDLRSARVGVLFDDEVSWPKKSYLEGFTHGSIHDNQDPKWRVGWLTRLTDPARPFSPQPYSQLADVLRRAGRVADARTIGIASEEAEGRRSHPSPSSKLWYGFFGPMIDYGYHPLKALRYGAGFVIAGTILFGLGFRTRLIRPKDSSGYDTNTAGAGRPKLILPRGEGAEEDKGEAAEAGDERPFAPLYPAFHSLVYSLDVFLPVINLYQGDYWFPNASSGDSRSVRVPAIPIRFRGRTVLTIPGWNLTLRKRWAGLGLRWYYWLHIIAGWTITTLIIAGLSGLIQR